MFFFLNIVHLGFVKNLHFHLSKIIAWWQWPFYEESVSINFLKCVYIKKAWRHFQETRASFSIRLRGRPHGGWSYFFLADIREWLKTWSHCHVVPSLSVYPSFEFNSTVSHSSFRLRCSRLCIWQSNCCCCCCRCFFFCLHLPHLKIVRM